jgi:hypothetical protein
VRAARCCRPMGLVLALLVSLTLGFGARAHAQSLSTADLAGTWSFFQLATPSASVNGSNIIAYAATVTFGADGSVTGSLSGGGLSGALAGTFGVTPDGQVQGFFSCCGDVAQDFVITGARMLANKDTIVGTATIFGQLGLFNLVKVEAQSFTVNNDLAGDWSYFEINPSDASLPSGSGNASWSQGLFRFHLNTITNATPNESCTEANLVRSDGSVRVTMNGAGTFG